MQYNFGYRTVKGIEYETLRTKGAEHTSYFGRCTIVQNFSDMDITDEFEVIEKFRVDEDAEGNKYGWYLIKNHIRHIDRYSPDKEKIATGISEAQDATCDLSIEVDARITEIEDALCELSEMEG